MPPSIRALTLCAVGLLFSGGLAGAETATVFELEPFEITAERSFLVDARLQALTYESWDARTLAMRALSTLDDLLDDAPAFSLYRRNSSTAAHPGTQGVSLRNLGPSATSRSLVLLDGLPQNDPFGSWVPWARYNPLSLESVSLVSPGQSGAWGNIASGGTVVLRSRDPFAGGTRLSATVADNATVRAALSTAQVLSETVALTVNGMYADEGGYPVVDPDFRGPVDEDAFSQSRNGSLHLAWKPSETWRWDLRADFFDEERGNGTPLARNDTQARDYSLQINRRLPAVEGSARFDLYFQDRQFYNQFTAVADGRATERPSLEQFDVPGQALGSAVSIEGRSGENLQWLLGTDLRFTEGGTNERYRNLGDGFTRRREAGGEQDFIGAYGKFQYKLSARWTVDGSLRWDRWSIRKAKRNEFNLETGLPSSTNAYPDRDGTFTGGGLGLTYQHNEYTQLSVRALRGFRLPTINELYRPFRVGNDITEANPDLTPETLEGFELVWTQRLDPAFDFSVSLFSYDWEDVVANVLLTDGGGGVSPVCGFVPAGGSCSQKQNVAESSVRGIESSLRWRPHRAFEFTLGHVWSQSEFERSALQPRLNGKRFPHSPEHRLTAGAEWSPNDVLTLAAQYEYWDSQYENAVNTLELDSFSLLRLNLDWAITPRLSATLALENASDTEIVTGVRGDGTINIGRGRTVLGTLRYAF